MSRRFLSILVICCACPSTIAYGEEPALKELLRFEAGEADTGIPVGWYASPPGTVRFDDSVVHGGNGAALFLRDAQSAGDFSRIEYWMPIDFDGDAVELRGFLQTKDVTGRVVLWMHTQAAGRVLDGDDMAGDVVHGTTAWSEHAVRVPLHPGARWVKFGALLRGQGQASVDDLQILVDGKPLAQVPKHPPVTAILEKDHEFDGGSGITLDSLSAQQVENAAVLGRIWGFLKYHHPGITSGRWHWDYELFRILPRVLEAGDAGERNGVLADWISRLGVPQHCDPCAPPPENAQLSPRLGWIEDTDLLGAELSRLLREVHRYRSIDEPQLYVSVPYKPTFENELGYADLVTPDAGFRILALFRFWAVIEYWSPYRNLIDPDWIDILREFLPRFVAARDRDEYLLEMLSLVARVQDGHGTLWHANSVRPPRGECFWPVHLDRIEGRFAVTSVAKRNGASALRVGDVIEAIDGLPIEALVETWSPYYPASNDAALARNISIYMSRGVCGESSVRIARGGQSLTLAVPRVANAQPWAFTHDRGGETFQLLSPKVAYIKLSSIRASDVDGYLAQAEGTRGLVVDIRNYPSDYVVFALGNRLVQKPTRFVRMSYGDIFNPGAFSLQQTQQVTPDGPAYAGKVAILVDELSQSQSEYTAMALRASPRAVVIGGTTAGADGAMTAVKLPGGVRATFSGVGIFYPDKTPTQRIGIVPDIRAEPTLEGIRQGRDEVLEAALRHILGEDVDDEVIREMARRR